MTLNVGSSKRDVGSLRLAKIRFIDEWEAGLKPTVERFTTQYPDFAEELAQFIMAFVAMEETVASVPEQAPTDLSRRAIERAVAQRVPKAVAEASATSLLDTAKASGLSMPKLVETLQLSNQSVLQILRGQVLAPPRYLIQLLADTLGRTVEQIAVSISRPLPAASLLAGHHRMVDAPSERPLELQQITFAHLIESCSDLTETRRSYWREIMECERAESDP